MHKESEVSEFSYFQNLVGQDVTIWRALKLCMTGQDILKNLQHNKEKPTGTRVRATMC
jgi:hypothetical protein